MTVSAVHNPVSETLARSAAQRFHGGTDAAKTTGTVDATGDAIAARLNVKSPWRTDGQQRRATAVLQALGRKLDPLDKGQIKQAATQMAATLFFQPLLQEMRKLNQGAKFAHGGRGEDVFGEQLDTRLADTIAATNPGGIAAQIATKLERDAQKHHRAGDTARQASWTTAVQAAQKN